jgi:hypothetical protein
MFKLPIPASPENPDTMPALQAAIAERTLLR